MRRVLIAAFLAGFAGPALAQQSCEGVIRFDTPMFRDVTTESGAPGREYILLARNQLPRNVAFTVARQAQPFLSVPASLPRDHLAPASSYTAVTVGIALENARLDLGTLLGAIRAVSCTVR